MRWRGHSSTPAPCCVIQPRTRRWAEPPPRWYANIMLRRSLYRGWPNTCSSLWNEEAEHPMHVLFVHRAFPAQFGRLALELTRRYGWKCSFLVEHLSRCPEPSPEMRRHLDIHCLPRPATAPALAPWPQRYGQVMERAQSLFEVVRA